ncbi:MAG: glycosyltransferase family 2 protein [Candidatus Omnitrophica bacterium]|nr:glycosyltransferase family 2 protein [Candidatus Omnitrophota bacterium]
MKIILWVSIAIIFYVYFAYPVIIYLLSLFYKKPLVGKYVYPTVSILVSAYNEEDNIDKKIQSLRELDYPEERMEILIGSDGSTDRTNAIASQYISERLKLLVKPKREGKPNMLNFLLTQAKGEILVFTDTRQRLDKNALKELLKYFSDPKVGSVSSELLYENEDHDNKTGSGIGLYWKYEKFIRKSESRMGSMLGATGALYAIRKELCPALPRDLILDDVYIPLKIVERGYRAIFDSKAKVYDRVFKDPKTEFLRKSRTLAGNYQLFFYLHRLFNPLRGKISWQFFSHKFLRLMVPFLLLIVLASNAMIVYKGNGSLFYLVLLWAQIGFYVLALLGAWFKTKNKLFDIPNMFCVMNAAAVVGLFRFVFRQQDVMWHKAKS